MARFVLASALLIALVATSAAAKVTVGTLDCSAKCTTAQCAIQKCDSAVPYACVGGVASGGCAKTPSHFDNTTSCTACCDISSCAISCTECTAAQCAATTCPSAVPFVCTSGSDKNGCAPHGSAWSENPGCKACCDSSKCPTPAPRVVKCNKACSSSMCHNAKRCPFSTPYMCTSGNATDGCSNSSTGWNGAGCDECCDVTLCPTTPCGKCDASTCNTTMCSQANPYICTGGVLSGGCNPTKDFWPESPDCTSCCDFDQCPGQKRK